MSSMLEIGPPELQRWYILVVSSLTSAFQCNTWFTISSVPTQVEQYYHLRQPAEGDVNGGIDLLLNWGPIMAFPSIPLTAYLLLFPRKGLAYSIRLSACLLFFGCLVRCVPCFLARIDTRYTVSNSLSGTLFFLHVGQILNAIAGVIIMSAQSKMSVIWFPEHERKFATGCLGIAGALGNCFSFLCGPYLVQSADDVPAMLYLDLALALVPFLCVVMYFPNRPSKLPSQAAKYAFLSIPFAECNANSNVNINEPLMIDERGDEESRKTVSMKENFANFVKESKHIVTSKGTILMVLVGGLQIGMSSAYNGVTQDMLSPLGLRFVSERF